MATKRTIRLQPIHGKFLQTTVNNHQINIWLVDPKTNQQGTEVPYDDAIAILSFNRPVATQALIKGKDGKYIQQLTDEDKELIAEAKANYGVLKEKSTSSDESSALTELVKNQSELIKTQSEFLKQMKSEIDDLKKSVKTDKKEKPNKPNETKEK